MSRFCFYHDDLDGSCAAAIIRKYFDGDVYCYPVNYNLDFPFHFLDEESEVYIVDYSLQKSGDWEKLLSITKNVVWIDHHETAINKSLHQGVSYLKGIREVGKAGCVLTWEYYFPSYPAPQAVLLVGDHDVWAFEFGEKTKHFNQGIMLLEDTRPNSLFWDKLLVDEGVSTDGPVIKELCSVGERILSKKIISDKRSLLSFGFEVEFEGFNCIAINKGGIGSDFFESIGKKYDILMPFIFDGEQYTVSLYQSGNGADIHMGEIAQSYGGGGHKGAAGFQCKELPFTFIKRLNQKGK